MEEYNKRAHMHSHHFIIDEKYREIIMKCEEQISDLSKEKNIKVCFYIEDPIDSKNIEKLLTIDPELAIGEMGYVNWTDKIIVVTITTYDDDKTTIYEKMLIEHKGVSEVIPRVVYDEELNKYKFVCFDLKMKEKQKEYMYDELNVEEFVGRAHASMDMYIINEKYRDIITKCKDQISKLSEEHDIKVSFYTEDSQSPEKLTSIDPGLIIGEWGYVNLDKDLITLTFVIYNDEKATPYEKMLIEHEGVSEVIPRVVYDEGTDAYNFICFDLKLEEE